jgi:hypothetical protein
MTLVEVTVTPYIDEGDSTRVFINPTEVVAIYDRGKCCAVDLTRGGFYVRLPAKEFAALLEKAS